MTDLATLRAARDAARETMHRRIVRWIVAGHPGSTIENRLEEYEAFDALLLAERRLALAEARVDAEEQVKRHAGAASPSYLWEHTAAFLRALLENAE